MAINGRTYDWESIEITGPGGRIIGAQSIDYKDEAKVEEVYGLGRDILGRGKGNYKASGSVELLRQDGDALISALGADFLGKADFTITVSYANDEGTTATDTLQKCVVSGVDTSAKQGEAKMTMKLELNIKKVLWNGTEPVVKK